MRKKRKREEKRDGEERKKERGRRRKIREDKINREKLVERENRQFIDSLIPSNVTTLLSLTYLFHGGKKERETRGEREKERKRHLIVFKKEGTGTSCFMPFILSTIF